jgi:hypothetical protein
LLPAYCFFAVLRASKSSGNFDAIYPDVLSSRTEEEKPKIACWMFRPLKTSHPV